MRRPDRLAPNAEPIKCPDCGGPAFELVITGKDGQKVRVVRCTDYRCRSGKRNGGAA